MSTNPDDPTVKFSPVVHKTTHEKTTGTQYETSMALKELMALHRLSSIKPGPVTDRMRETARHMARTPAAPTPEPPSYDTLGEEIEKFYDDRDFDHPEEVPYAPVEEWAKRVRQLEAALAAPIGVEAMPQSDT